MFERKCHAGTAGADGRHIRTVCQQADKNKKEGIINKVFVDMLDKLGYDIRLAYVNKKGATEA